MSIEISRLSKRYGSLPVLQDFSLTLPESGCVCLSGPSGCGKTTLLRLLAGLEQADGGTVTGLAGKRLSMVFQEDRLLPWCSALENIRIAAPEADATRWLRLFGLWDAAQKLPGELSHGMRQRVAVARALAYGGDVLLLDEPFKGLDEARREQVMQTVWQVWREKLILLVTHDHAEAARLAQTVYRLWGTPLAVRDILSFPTPPDRRTPEEQARYRAMLTEP